MGSVMRYGRPDCWPPIGLEWTQQEGFNPAPCLSPSSRQAQVVHVESGYVSDGETPLIIHVSSSVKNLPVGNLITALLSLATILQCTARCLQNCIILLHLIKPPTALPCNIFACLTPTWNTLPTIFYLLIPFHLQGPILRSSLQRDLP